MISQQELLQSAIELVQAGRLGDARDILRQLVEDYPAMQTAWAWLAEIQPDDAHRAEVMRQCLQHNPQSTMARGALAQYEHRQEHPSINAASKPVRTQPPRPVPLSESDEIPDVVQLLQNPPPTPAPAQKITPPVRMPDADLRAALIIREIAVEPPSAPPRTEGLRNGKSLRRVAGIAVLLIFIAAAALLLPRALTERRQADAAERAQLAATLQALNEEGDRLLMRSAILGSPLTGPYIATPRPDIALPSLRATVAAVETRIAELAEQVEQLEDSLVPTPGP